MSTILGIFEKVCLDFFPLTQSGFQNVCRVEFLTHHKKEVADILYIATVITHVCVFAALQDFTALKLFSNPVIFLYPSGGVLKSSSSTLSRSLCCVTFWNPLWDKLLQSPLQSFLLSKVFTTLWTESRDTLKDVVAVPRSWESLIFQLTLEG